MSNSTRLSAASLLAVLLLPVMSLGANSQIAETASGGDQIIAQGGGVSLGGADVRALIADLPATERQAASSNLNSLEQFVHAALVRRAMLADLKSSGFDRQPQTTAQLQGLRDDELLRLWVARASLVPSDYPSEAELQAAYAANKQALAAPTQYRLAQIFINAPDGGNPGKLAAALSKAVDIAHKLPTSDFAQLARSQSEDTQSASHGGDLGYLPADRMLPAILAAVRSLQPGQVAGPIKTAQGLHFLKLLDSKAGQVPTLEQVHDRLVVALRNRRAAQLEQAYLTSYDAKLGVTVNQIELARLQSTLAR